MVLAKEYSLLFFLFICTASARGNWRKLLQGEQPQEDVEQLEADLKLLDSAEAGNVGDFEKALQQDASAYGADGFGWTPLHFAAFAGSSRIVQVLLARNARTEAKTVSASQKNGVFTAEQSTPLHIAAAFGHANVIKLLVDNGANVSARDLRGWTPIARATRSGHVEAVQALIDGGATVDDEGKLSPLHLAALLGYVDVAEVLVRGGADVDARTSSGETPLHYGSQYGREEIIKFLLSNEADPAIANNSGKFPEDVVCLQNEGCPLELKDQLKDILKVEG